jgi:hypothetical protein
MTESVPFKVYLATGQPNRNPPSATQPNRDAPHLEDLREVRRFALAAAETTFLACLEGKLKEIFPQLISAAGFTVSWKDKDGDEVIK